MQEKESFCCETTEIHEDLLEIVNRQMPPEEELYGLAEALHMTQSAISHQLKILKNSRLVKSRRVGKSVFYSLADSHVRTMIDQGREHIEE